MKEKGLRAVLCGEELASGERGVARLWKSREGIGLEERVEGYTPCVTESVRNRMMGKGLRRFRRVQWRAGESLADRESIDTGAEGMDERRMDDLGEWGF